MASGVASDIPTIEGSRVDIIRPRTYFLVSDWVETRMRLMPGRKPAPDAFSVGAIVLICYLDESGTPEAGSNSSHFVLLGIAIPAQSWKEKDREVDAVKRRFGLERAEIHAAWMARDYPEQATVHAFESLSWTDRRDAVVAARTLNLSRPRTNNQQRSLLRNYVKSEPYVHLSREERFDCLFDLAALLAGWGDARIFAEAQDKVHGGNACGFDSAFEQVVTRFNTYLELTSQALGLLVQDNNQTVSRRLTEMMRSFHDSGTSWSEITRIVETPMFVDSGLTSMVQLADLSAFATRRFFEKGQVALFDRLYRRFDWHQGTLVGLRHYTGAHECRCRVCIDHGRYRL
jgi:hypothetical protein